VSSLFRAQSGKALIAGATASLMPLTAFITASTGIAATPAAWLRTGTFVFSIMWNRVEGISWKWGIRLPRSKLPEPRAELSDWSQSP